MTHEQLIAELVRENERLRRQVADAQRERDQYKEFYLGELARHAEDLTPEELENAAPAIPLLDAAIKRLEQP
jgi:hypothetical protein